MRTMASAAALLLGLLAAGCNGEVVGGGQRPAQLLVVSGDLQAGTVGQELPQPLVVKVVDDDGNPVREQLVNFRVTRGGGSVFAGSAITNRNGIAQERWTLGTVADTQQVEARAVDTQTGAPIVFATFRAVGLPSDPTAVAALPPATRTGAAGQVLADSLEARVTDTYGNPVPGVPLVWSVAAGGGSVSPGTSTTDAEGVARAAWTLGTQLGPPQVAEASLSPAVRAEFTATASIPMGAALVKVSGDGQTAVAGSALPAAVVVEARTSGGQLLSGVPVSWAPGAGSGTATPPASQTGPDGRASTTWTLGPGAGAQALMASAEGTTPVTFGATATPGSAATLAITGGGGQTAPPTAALPQPLRVLVRDAHGNPVPGVTVTWTVTAGGGSVVPTQSATGADGVAQTQWTLGPTVGTQTLRAAAGGVAPADFTATGKVGAVASVEVTPAAVNLAWFGQTAQLTARAADAYGNTVPGVTFTWTSTQPGVATVTQAGLVTGVANGAAEVRASATGVTGEAQATVQQVPATVGITGGTAVIETDTLQLGTIVRDARNNVIAGAAVTWSSSNAGVATVSPAGLVASTGGGSATITATTANGVSDTHTVTVHGALRADTLAVGTDHACTLGGSGQAACWGSNVTAQIAFTGVTRAFVPRAVAGYGFASITTGGTATSVNLDSHSCGVEADGDAYCWGNNESGQLGYDDERDDYGTGLPGCRVSGSLTFICNPTPTQVAGGGWTQLDAGAHHTCGVTTGGDLYCWGRSDTGQLGTAAATRTCNRLTTTPEPFPCILTPAAVSGALSWRQVSAGGDFTCAVTTGGAVYCWGRNEAGQLGSGSGPAATAPVAVTGGTGYARVSAGGRHACGVTAGGAIRCWGDNGSGQLGNGATGGSSATPVAVPAPGDGSTWADVIAGITHTCAVTSTGRAFCWGANGTGQLGDGTTTPRPSPTPVTTALRFTTVGVGAGYSCGAATNGVAYCWGTSAQAKLGNGDTSIGVYPPTPVRAP